MLYIKNAVIKTMAGVEYQNGQILIEDGKIKAVGEAVERPAGADELDAGGKLVTPGLVDAHCHIGLFGTALRWESEDANEELDPITPQLRGIDSVNPMDEGFENAQKGGVTCVCTGPGSGNVIGGTFTALKTHGSRVDDMVMIRECAMKIAFGENPKSSYGLKDKSPYTRMAVAALLREALFKAKRYSDDLEEYERSQNPEKKRPPFDMKMEALLPVIRKQMPLKSHAHRADDIFTSIRVAREFGLDITLDHCTEGHLIADALAAEGWPVLIGPTFGDKTKPEMKNKTFDTLKVLTDAGLKVSIITDAPFIPIERLTLCAGYAITAGVDEQTAWECITINPAEVIGVADRVGSIAPGKDADLVIHSGNPLRDIGSQVLYTFIDGQLVYKA
ncbi:amidohydrolase [Ruminococcaceae bacterium OttesenSCG-928-D13]|nr:amidohydrolase [Ruminococcaceae bacterium OttesenSCG-928-D13]